MYFEYYFWMRILTTPTTLFPLPYLPPHVMSVISTIPTPLVLITMSITLVLTTLMVVSCCGRVEIVWDVWVEGDITLKPLT